MYAVVIIPSTENLVIVTTYQPSNPLTALADV